MSQKIYDESSIESLGPVGGVQKRFSMYVDAVGKLAVLKLIQEGIQNSTDEIKEGGCNYIIIDINTKKREVIISDNGRGIPIGKLDTIMLEPHSGGKFSQTGYESSSGMNGLGLFLTNCLSYETEVQVWRDNKHVTAVYNKGYRTREIKEEDNTENKRGTYIRFVPNIEILFDPKNGVEPEEIEEFVDKDILFSIIDALSHINPNTVYELIFNGKSKKYLFTGGFSDYLKELISRDHKHPMCNIFTHKSADKELSMSYQVAFTFIKDQDEYKFYSYINQFPTVKHGVHVDGVKSSISRVITNYIKNNNYIPKTCKYKITGADVIDNIYGLILGTLTNPLYTNQTKECLTSKNYGIYIQNKVYNEFNDWANTHRDDMDKICKLAVLKAKANNAAKEAKETMMEAGGVKNVMKSNVDLKKFTDCSGNNPEENELFLVEGDSAGGSVTMARNSKTQAYYRSRGKILNVIDKKHGVISAEEEAVLTILGIGSGNKQNIDKLKYHKIIIMSDADPDGGHIASLWMTFFLIYAPKLIENGNIYIANPPFYQIILNKKFTLNILNEQYFQLYKEELALKLFNLLDNSKKELPKGLFRVFIKKLLGFKELLDSYSIELNIHPILLELIVRNFESLIKGNYSQFKLFDYIVKETKSSKTYKIFEFDKEYNHYYLRIDHLFYENIYKTIYKRMCEIYLSNVKLQVIESKKIFSGTLYELNEIINYPLEGSKQIELKRYKGLGEMASDLLKETCMDPLTRKLTKVTMKDAKKAMEYCRLLMSGDDMVKKKSLLNSAGHFTNIS
jgi:DNA gyrase subunit B